MSRRFISVLSRRLPQRSATTVWSSTRRTGSSAAHATSASTSITNRFSSASRAFASSSSTIDPEQFSASQSQTSTSSNFDTKTTGNANAKSSTTNAKSSSTNNTEEESSKGGDDSHQTKSEGKTPGDESEEGGEGAEGASAEKRVGNPISWPNPMSGPTMDDKTNPKWKWVYPIGASMIMLGCLISRRRNLKKQKEAELLGSPNVNAIDTSGFQTRRFSAPPVQ